MPFQPSSPHECKGLFAPLGTRTAPLAGVPDKESVEQGRPGLFNSGWQLRDFSIPPGSLEANNPDAPSWRTYAIIHQSAKPTSSARCHLTAGALLFRPLASPGRWPPPRPCRTSPSGPPHVPAGKLKDEAPCASSAIQGACLDNGGEGGIRTHDTGFSPYTRLAGELLRPTRTPLRGSRTRGSMTSCPEPGRKQTS